MLPNREVSLDDYELRWLIMSISSIIDIVSVHFRMQMKVPNVHDVTEFVLPVENCGDERIIFEYESNKVTDADVETTNDLVIEIKI